MPINACQCGVKFAIGLMRCPRCKTIAPQYAASVKEEKGMPRITVADGPSNAGAVSGEVGFIEREERKAAEVVHEAAAEVVTEVHAVTDWAEKTLAHLRGEAKSRGLSVSGAKADLAARLAEHDAKQAPVEPETPAAVPAEAAPEAAPAAAPETAASAPAE